MTTPARVIVLVGAALLVVHLAAMEIFRKPDGRVVFGDATHHFVQLRSIVFDRDLHFENEYRRIYKLQGGEPNTEWVTSEHTVTGYVRNYMPVGPALLWMPLYLIVAAAQLVLSWVGLASPPDGFDRALQLVPGITGVLASTAATLIAFRVACRYASERASLIGVLGIWLGSHAIYYSMVSPSYSHTASMLASSLFFWRWLTTRSAPTVTRIVGWGALAGIAALMRWQDAIFLAIPLIEAARWRQPWLTRSLAAGGAVAAFFAVFSPQMAVWTVLYGQPLALPQGAGFMRWTSPHLIDVLLSDNHGLLLWTPIVAVALAGLASLTVRERGILLPVWLVVIASWYVNAAVADWWAGEAYGSRRFLSLYPLFVAGLAWWVAGGRRETAPVRWRVASVIALIAANALLLLQYQLYMKGLTTLSPYPGGWFNMFLVRFVVPIRLLQSWMG